MKKKLLIIFLALTVILLGTVIYLDKVYLPIKVKALLISGLQQATQKKVSLGSLHFSIFKGVVLKNLALSDKAVTIFSLEEASCAVLLWPFFQKQIIIPSLSIRSPVVFLERRPDGTFNLADLFPQKKAQAAGKKFSLFVYSIKIIGGRINFQDDTLKPEFTTTLDNLKLSVSLSLPTSVKFNLKGEIPGGRAAAKISAQGEFKIPQQETVAEINLQNLSPQEFLAYYKRPGISFPQGVINASLKLNFKNNLLAVDMEADTRGLLINKDIISAKLDSAIKGIFQYSFQDRQFNYSGSATIASCDIYGIKFAEQINNIKGRLDFFVNQLKWSDFNFKYLNVLYKTSGILTDFKAPGVQLELSSPGLRLESIFAVNKKLINLSKCSGNYLNSDFSVTGNIDLSEEGNPRADIQAGLMVNLGDAKEVLKKFKSQLEKMKPAGIVNAQLNLSGNLNDFKSCAIKGSLSSPEISLWGLKSEGLTMDYNQSDGLIDIPLLNLPFYGGVIDAAGKMNLLSENLPFMVNLNIRDVKIEKLKLDTGAKDKDIAGTIRAEAKINGFSDDLAKLGGAGQVFINDGKLWELNLFKGMGVLLFTKDFNAIFFHEGYCAFIIQDKSIFSDSIKLKSNLAELTGSAKIGFDGSIDAALEVKVSPEAPLSGTFKDVTTAIMGEAEKFGVIKISGTLKDPKYKFKTAVFDIINTIKDIFLKQ